MSLGSPQYRKKAYVVAQRPTPDHTEFGPNEWLVDELHQQYLTDKNSVDPAWWGFFADYQPSDTPNGQSHQSGRAQEPNGPPSSRPAPSRPPEPAAPFPAAPAPPGHPPPPPHPTADELGDRRPAAQGRGGPHRHEHGVQPRDPDGDERAR